MNKFKAIKAKYLQKFQSFSQRGRNAIFLIVILVGLAVTLGAIRYRQIYSTKAADSVASYIEFRSSDNAQLTKDPANDQHFILTTSSDTLNLHFKGLAVDTDIQGLGNRQAGEEKEIEGTLLAYDIHHKNGTASYDFVFLPTNRISGKPIAYSVNFKTTPSINMSGKKIKIKGSQNGTIISADSYSVITPQVRPDDPPGQSSDRVSPVGNHKLAVVKVNFIDSNDQPFTDEELQDIFVRGNMSVDSYFRQNSNNLLSFDTIDIYTTTSNLKGNECQQGVQQLTDAINQFSSTTLTLLDLAYNSYILILARGNNCEWGAFASLGGRPSYVVVRDLASIPNTPLSDEQKKGIFIAGMNHELSHNLNLRHANRALCNNGSVDINNCRSEEYQDKSDVLTDGLGIFSPEKGVTIPNFNAPHKLSADWIRGGEQRKSLSLSSPGEYKFRIYPIDDNENNLKIVTIPISTRFAFFPPGVQNGIYFLSYRKSQQYRGSLPIEFISGVNVHMGYGVRLPTDIIRIGTFIDSFNKITVTNDAVSPDRYVDITVKIGF